MSERREAVPSLVAYSTGAADGTSPVRVTVTTGTPSPPTAVQVGALKLKADAACAEVDPAQVVRSIKVSAGAR
jgi:hypothetical protein